MNLTEIEFEPHNGKWVAAFEAKGTAVIQLQRTEEGSIYIYQHLEGMDPVLKKIISKSSVGKDALLTLTIPAGVQVTIESTSEVISCKLLESAGASAEPSMIPFSTQDEAVCYDSEGEPLFVRF